MSDRDELAGLLFTTDNSKAARPWSEWEHSKQHPRLSEYVYAMADALLAAGYRKPRTITTAEELDALPENTAIIGTSWEPKLWPGTPYVKLSNGEWHDYGNDYSVGSDDILLPATITFAPESQS